MINNTAKFQGSKLMYKKSIAFLYTNSEMSGKEMKKTNPFAMATKGIKYLGVNLAKEVKACTPKITRHR